MKRTIDFYWTQRIVDFLVKIAGVVVTSSATLAVAHDAFSYMPQPWLNVITLGALILVEGAFVASWMAIDFQHSAPMAMKVAWSITLIVIYLALLVLAMEHGEGAAGWAFRFVLAVMIGRSIYEAGVYEVLKSNRKADRNIRSSFSVKRMQRQLAKQNAMKALTMESTQSNYALELGREISKAKIEAEHEAAIVDVQLMRKRLVDNVHAKNNLAHKKMLQQIQVENHMLEKQYGTPS